MTDAFLPPGVAVADAALIRDILADLRAANRITNLVADDSDAAMNQHALDSLHALADPAAASDNARIIDVGTGGGFPGLILLAARPSWRGTLLDGVKKKTDILADILSRRLPGRGEALWGRSELAAREDGRRDAYDLAFCRAVGRFSMVMELTLPFLKPGGALLAHRGHDAPEEIIAARVAAETLGARIDGTTRYDLPGLDKPRHIVRVVKTAPTPPTYPRRDGMPAKRPL
jgi:16S rRNA (guanine527-N7)-methyltransferase